MKNLGSGVDYSYAKAFQSSDLYSFSFILNALRQAVPHEEELREGRIVSVIFVPLFF